RADGSRRPRIWFSPSRRASRSPAPRRSSSPRAREGARFVDGRFHNVQQQLATLGCMPPLSSELQKVLDIPPQVEPWRAPYPPHPSKHFWFLPAQIWLHVMSADGGFVAAGIGVHS